jgi:hypothetical protein
LHAGKALGDQVGRIGSGDERGVRTGQCLEGRNIKMIKVSVADEDEVGRRKMIDGDAGQQTRRADGDTWNPHANAFAEYGIKEDGETIDGEEDGVMPEPQGALQALAGEQLLPLLIEVIVDLGCGTLTTEKVGKISGIATGGGSRARGS